LNAGNQGATPDDRDVWGRLGTPGDVSGRLGFDLTK
jgi:hypothetical protein